MLHLALKITAIRFPNLNLEDRFNEMVSSGVYHSNDYPVQGVAVTINPLLYKQFEKLPKTNLPKCI
jgi:hypothetical protein